MKTFVLEGKVREGLGKKATRELRKGRNVFFGTHFKSDFISATAFSMPT